MAKENNQLKWQPNSWQQFPATQQPIYQDPTKVSQVLEQLSTLPPLVTSWEIEALREHIAEAQDGKAFILQGGDCAETFADCRSDKIAAKLKILLQMSLVMLYGLQKPIVRIGRMGGQYAKPRSANSETRDNVTLPSFRGDLVNREAFTFADREPDPELMLRGYERAALTLNFVRSLIDGGFADLHHPENWDLDWVQHSQLENEYHEITRAISSPSKFIEAIPGEEGQTTARVDFYTSHEGLQLPYEQAQTRFLDHRKKWYNLSTHFPWIGMRTAQLDGAHVEYFRGIANPVGIKLGPGITEEWLLGLLENLNPDNEPGRLTLIHRFGAAGVEEGLPPLIKTVRNSGAKVLWMCDPMHGNTESASNGFKTRRFDNILSELQTSFRIHQEMDSWMGGVHFELTGENVTECTGGARGLTDTDLEKAYHTQVDPRLNYEQAMEMAMRIAGLRR
ncbi:MAG: 3-deoxy-7-phosphoheptulonate synthase class II [Gammaproteobacteria bacterium]|nr:3-deoxy-7-phosphoheptulonate synthase class II [Gammaproteobacteria bacterium]MCP4090457.1 3-deoxy-7-phosphoheptulonate synthase class II [Gammaproteobacteria bacterium]MCP4275432.1 3-deoxy-7-phosphoheptulonate synthase class II [Gammaproteobacteria bacterium]MCP4832591.1 3-deoxy-7-phosphoheptulonate synthase class II [Gammaproteobacteria bacterium]MCP4928110.1 3-deoxy-7-phosphoheptulonate synthase class II [Gammaproteobacteria bacterium]